MRQRCLLAVFAFFLVFTGVAGSAPKKPVTVAELALYNGPDRQEVLEEGAKKDGALLFYTAGILKYGVQAIVDAFEKKYPYIKVQIWRAGSDQVIPRIIEEYKSGKHLFDALEGTQPTQILAQSLGIIQPYYSPNLAYIEEGGITRASGQGVFSAAFRENAIVLGYNTKLIAKGQLPKTYHDLLNAQWQGKVAIAGTDTGQNWVATLLTAYGEGFVKQIAEQKFAIHVVSAAALLDMVANGEYTFSPTLYDNHLIESKRTGAPVDWVPLEPAYVTVGKIAISAHSSHPHAALLFADFELSKESAEIHRKFGHGPTRKDVQGVSTFKKFYGAKTREEVLKWDEFFNRVFLKR